MKRNKRVIPVSQEESSSRSESPEPPISFVRNSTPALSSSTFPSNSRNHHFSLENLLSVITPPPELLPTPWKSGFDLHTRTVFFYKVDLENDNLKITKSVRVRCREPLSKNGKPLLIPSLYIGDAKLHPSCATIIMGHEEIQGEEDLMKLLQHVDFCPRNLVSGDELPVYHEAKYSPPRASMASSRNLTADAFQSQEIPLVIDVQQDESPESVAGPSDDDEPVNLELKATLPYPYSCANCHVDNTTLWRRDPNGNPVCNACGLYYRMYGVPRPAAMRRDAIRTRTPKQRILERKEKAAAASMSGNTAGINKRKPAEPEKPRRVHGTIRDDLECSNCHTRNTILWRRNAAGNRVCNACALYTKLHGVPRPQDLWREEILKRKQKQRTNSRDKKPTMVKKETIYSLPALGGVDEANESLNYSTIDDNISKNVTLASMIVQSSDSDNVSHEGNGENASVDSETEADDAPFVVIAKSPSMVKSEIPFEIHNGDQ